MTAEVIPFPLVRRHDLVQRQASFFARQPGPVAERNLAHQMEVQRRTLARRGVATHVVEAQVTELELAIRGEAGRSIFGGAA